MYKNKKIILIVLIILSFYGLFFYTQINLSPPNPSQIFGEKKEDSQNTKTILEISGKKYESKIVGEVSVYDFMDSFRKKGEMTFTEKNYTGMGKFIETINGIKRDRNHSWIFYVNNKKSSVGVSNYKIKLGDVVSWKYEENY